MKTITEKIKSWFYGEEYDGLTISVFIKELRKCDNSKPVVPVFEGEPIRFYSKKDIQMFSSVENVVKSYEYPLQDYEPYIYKNLLMCIWDADETQYFVTDVVEEDDRVVMVLKK